MAGGWYDGDDSPASPREDMMRLAMLDASEKMLFDLWLLFPDPEIKSLLNEAKFTIYQAKAIIRERRQSECLISDIERHLGLRTDGQE